MILIDLILITRWPAILETCWSKNILHYFLYLLLEPQINTSHSANTRSFNLPNLDNGIDFLWRLVIAKKKLSSYLRNHWQHFTRQYMIIFSCFILLQGILLSSHANVNIWWLRVVSYWALKTVDITVAVEEKAITGHVLTKTSCCSVLLFCKCINFVTKHPQTADDKTHKKISIVEKGFVSILV